MAQVYIELPWDGNSVISYHERDGNTHLGEELQVACRRYDELLAIIEMYKERVEEYERKCY